MVQKVAQNAAAMSASLLSSSFAICISCKRFSIFSTASLILFVASARINAAEANDRNVRVVLNSASFSSSRTRRAHFSASSLLPLNMAACADDINVCASSTVLILSSSPSSFDDEARTERCFAAATVFPKNTQIFPALARISCFVALENDSFGSATSMRFSIETLITSIIFFASPSSLARPSTSLARASSVSKSIENIFPFLDSSARISIANVCSAHFVNIDDALDRLFKRMKFAPRSAAILKSRKYFSSSSSFTILSSAAVAVVQFSA